MIRELPVDELNSILGIAQRFFNESKEPGVFNPEFFIKSCKKLYDFGCGRVFVSEKNDVITGIFGCTLDHEYITGDLVVDELFWYGDARLFKYVEKWGNKLGAKRMYISNTLELTPDRLRDFYKSNGYTHRYDRHVKELSHGV